MERERRRYYRQPVKMAVSVVVGDKEIKASSTNISEGGIALALRHAVPKNVQPRVQFTLPGTTTSMDMEGEVAWADLKGHVGLRFLNVPPSSQEFLENWITQQAEEPSPSPKEKHASTPPEFIQ